MKGLCLPMLRLPISSSSIKFLKRQFEKFRGTEFVDEGSKKDIDLLIGSVLCWSLDGLSGCVGVSGKMQSVNFVTSATIEVQIDGENDELESQLKWFRELKSLGINIYKQSFNEKYLNTICRNKYNRYEVRLSLIIP